VGHEPARARPDNETSFSFDSGRGLSKEAVANETETAGPGGGRPFYFRYRIVTISCRSFPTHRLGRTQSVRWQVG